MPAIDNYHGHDIEEIYDLADKIEATMETKPLGHGWTPSAVARKAKITTGQAYVALRWMVDNVFVTADERGAWTHYYRRH